MANDEWGDRKKILPRGVPTPWDNRRSSNLPAVGNMPTPPAPPGGAIFGKWKWNAIAGLLEAYTKAINNATSATLALDNLDKAKFQREQTKSFLANAHHFHADGELQRQMGYMQTREMYEQAKHDTAIRARRREREAAEDLAAHEAWKQKLNPSYQKTSTGKTSQNRSEEESIKEYEIENFIKTQTGGLGENDLPPAARQIVFALRQMLTSVKNLQSPPDDVKAIVAALKAILRGT